MAISALNAASWRVEAENAGSGITEAERVFPGQPASTYQWKVEQSPDASGGAFLGGMPRFESRGIAVNIPKAGTYRIWVRHYSTPDAPSGFSVIIRDDVDEAVQVERIDWVGNMIKEQPYQAKVFTAPAKDAKPSFVWSSFDVTFERPMKAMIAFGFAGGTVFGKIGVDALVITDEKGFDPQKSDWAKLATDGGTIPAQTPPAGLKPLLPMTLTTDFFSGVTNRKNQFWLTFINNNPVYRDYAWILQLGGNHDQGFNGGSSKYGIGVFAGVDFGYDTPELYKQVATPEGRFVNSDGKVSKTFSFSYEPYRKAVIEKFAKDLSAFKDDEVIDQVRIMDESVGRMDYSDVAKARFHKWLAERYGQIGKLNELWDKKYESFDVVPLAKSPDDGVAEWFAFREFSGLELVSLVGEKNKVLKQDPRQRSANSQMSCLSILAPEFTTSGPLDIEDMINIGFAGQPTFGIDAYSTEDYFAGNDFDFLLSFAKDKAVTNNEWNVHTPDPRIAARTYWGMVAKGLKGIATYMLQQNSTHWQSPMWGLLNVDFTPGNKLAVIAQANHEIHRLEPLLMGAKPVPFVKPVALYFSRMDLSIPQSLWDMYGTQIDNPYRVYAILRGLGYPVRWITPKQIDAGELKDVGAVVMVNVKYVPQNAANKLAEWVKGGGSLIGDQWPGIYNEYGRPQNTLGALFGIQATVSAKAKPNAKDAKLALQETSSTVYGVEPDVLRALNTGKDMSKTVDEMWEQWDSKHPISKDVGRFHLSGYGFTSIDCVAGHVIGMAAGGPGRPALVVNDYGKGHTLYSALMLGTLYDSGPIRYEWDSAREGTSLSRILDAYLRFCGLEPFAKTGLPAPAALRTRIENPLVDAKKNVLVGMISTNDMPLPPFALSLRWPDSAPRPKMLLVVTDGTRQMQQVPFEIKDGKLELKMPGFDTHATLLALTDSDPLVSMEITGVPHGGGELAEVTPGSKLTVKATVWNPSARKLGEGDLKMYGASGWFCNENTAKVGAIQPYSSSKETSFEVVPPEACSKLTLKPLVLKYQAGKVNSTPCTELVWWMNKADVKSNLSLK
ncbi:MAG: beta-galactosidase [Chthoniobacterales bacterium]